MLNRSHTHYKQPKLEDCRRKFFLVEATALALLTAVVGTAAVGVGVGELATGGKLFGGGDKQKQDQQNLLGSAPAAPSPEDAAAKADATLTQNRRTLLASGGNTDVTGGAPILSGNVKQNVLLGG